MAENNDGPKDGEPRLDFEARHQDGTVVERGVETPDMVGFVSALVRATEAIQRYEEGGKGGKSGPAMVNSDAFRANWDNIFGKGKRGSDAQN